MDKVVKEKIGALLYSSEPAPAGNVTTLAPSGAALPASEGVQVLHVAHSKRKEKRRVIRRTSGFTAALTPEEPAV